MRGWRGFQQIFNELDFRPNATQFDTIVSFIAFLVLEVAIGMYFPAISYLRSQVIPESHRANVMNWFRCTYSDLFLMF